MEPIKCFWLEETSTVQRYLRRYHADCKAPYRFMRGMHFVDEVQMPANTTLRCIEPLSIANESDQRWPKTCDCGRDFEDSDARTVILERVYQRQDSKEYTLLRNAPLGAMWDAWWYGDWRRGPDGKHLMCRVPERHDWFIDGRANNCTLPKDEEHRCWIRHGEPPELTVDKKGLTCEAGQGSILTPQWHGFLTNGRLTTCG